MGHQADARSAISMRALIWTSVSARSAPTARSVSRSETLSGPSMRAIWAASWKKRSRASGASEV